jgi:hypothetical protein
MPENLKRFRVRYSSKAGGQVVTLMARNRAEAEILAGAHQARRATRYDITHQRLSEALERGDLTKEQHAAELERRKKDFSRYDIVSGDQVGSADAPLKLEKIEEVK